ncbi:MAG: mycothiol conjugate amidase Mca [Bifidobacteriaceae bacterium]|jgi:mycothiol S-conjugate amidase|nr:mycothiol conjugate amidase Mca [Bifidobacteriaceae bacterium]
MSRPTSPAGALRLMAVHAHPDDESSKGAATLAKYAAEGVEVLVATLTGGERGEVLNPRLRGDPSVEGRLAEVRVAEMAAAAAALGVSHRFVGFVDSGFPQGDPPPPPPPGSFASIPAAEAAVPLAALIRDVRPHVITTYDPSGGYPHPDHIHTHAVTVEAIEQAADGDRTPPGQRAWAVPKVYYDHGFSRERSRALHEALVSRGVESPLGEWLERDATRKRRVADPTTRIDVGDYFGARDAALRAHATQIDPDGFFFAIPRDVEREVWPWEEFELAHSTVRVDTPEDDLFAGLR